MVFSSDGIDEQRIMAAKPGKGMKTRIVCKVIVNVWHKLLQFWTIS